MQIIKKVFRPGDRVVYIPNHAWGDRYHPDCEHGTISSIGTGPNGFIFVKFDPRVARLGWDGATAEACDADSLVLER